MSPYRVPFIFQIVDGLFTPQRSPGAGDVIRIGKPTGGSYRSISVDSKWQVHHELRVYDTISIVFYNYTQVFQIQPTENEWYGKFVEVRREKIENHAPKSKKKFFVLPIGR